MNFWRKKFWVTIDFRIPKFFPDLHHHLRTPVFGHLFFKIRCIEFLWFSASFFVTEIIGDGRHHRTNFLRLTTGIKQERRNFFEKKYCKIILWIFSEESLVKIFRWAKIAHHKKIELIRRCCAPKIWAIKNARTTCRWCAHRKTGFKAHRSLYLVCQA